MLSSKKKLVRNFTLSFVIMCAAAYLAAHSCLPAFNWILVGANLTMCIINACNYYRLHSIGKEKQALLNEIEDFVKHRKF